MWTTQELKLGHTKELGHRASMSKTAALAIAVSAPRHPYITWHLECCSSGQISFLLRLFQKILSLLFLAFLILIHVALY